MFYNNPSGQSMTRRQNAQGKETSKEGPAWESTEEGRFLKQVAGTQMRVSRGTTASGQPRLHGWAACAPSEAPTRFNALLSPS